MLGIILGGPLEERFIQAFTGANGSLMGLVNRPVAALLASVCAILWLVALVAMRKSHAVPIREHGDTDANSENSMTG